MRLSCGRLEQCRVQSECLSTNFGSIKIRPVFPLPPVYYLLSSCLPPPSLPALLSPLLLSPRIGQRPQHQNYSLVVRTSPMSLMQTSEEGGEAMQGRGREASTQGGGGEGMRGGGESKGGGRAQSKRGGRVPSA